MFTGIFVWFQIIDLIMEGLECTEICTEISYTVSLYIYIFICSNKISATAGIVVMLWVPDVDFYMFIL